MPMYLTRFSYTPETRARLVKNPEDRRAATRNGEGSGARPIATRPDDRTDYARTRTRLI